MHPLTNDLTALSDDELHKKHSELQKRLTQAYTMGPVAIIPQIQMVMADYQNEVSRRNQKQMEDLMNRADKDGKRFNNIIDIK